MSASVYFIQMGEDGPIKIGIAKSPEGRAKNLQTASPHPLRIIGTIIGDARRLEARAHAAFAEHRLNGEWFSPAPEILEAARTGVIPFPAPKPMPPRVERAPKPKRERETSTFAFRVPLVRRKELELIGAMKGHATLSDTLRDVIDEFVERYLRQQKAA